MKPDDLAAHIGIDISNTAAAPSSNGQPPAPADTNAREKVDPIPSVVQDELAIRATRDEGGRSKDTYRIICMCVDCGLSLPQTRWVIDQRTDLAERVRELLARAKPIDDVAESYAKALGEWHRAQQPVMASPGPQAAAGGASQGPAPASAPTTPTPGSARFFSKGIGFRALDCALEVMATVVCGFGPLDERFYTYEGGVWTPGTGPIAAEVVRLLGNRYRPTHVRNITDIIEHQPATARISDEPLADFINVPNGMVRWSDGAILPHDPDYLSTVQLPVEYVPGSLCPQFDKYLAEVLPADLVEVTPECPYGWIWELIGYTLYSGNPLHVAVLLFGKGRNGKGTLIRVLKCVLGEHNISAVTLHELTENKFRSATLYGKLANLAGDLDGKWLENTALFKKVTGHDSIQGEYKYGASFNFDPWALPFYSANKAFGSPDSSEGWVARWVVVPFPNSFLGREDRLLDAKLTSEGELRGILAKGIAALPALMARGNFADTVSLREAKTAFVVASDAVRSWLDECCVIDPAAWTPRTDLFKAYRWHTGGDGGKQLGAREFYNRVDQVAGIIATIRQGTRGFSGVQVKPGWSTGVFAGQTP